MDVNNFSDEDLKQLMIKYKEKQSRYELIYNEATQRNERIILNIHLEQQRRWRKTLSDLPHNKAAKLSHHNRETMAPENKEQPARIISHQPHHRLGHRP